MYFNSMYNLVCFTNPYTNDKKFTFKTNGKSQRAILSNDIEQVFPGC